MAAREIDLVRVVGRSTPLRLFELLDETAPSHDALAGYAEGLAQYRERRFVEAERCFRSAGDPPALVMADRCAVFAKNPPPADWDGTHQLSRK
jgi:adenylate cyclase